MHHDISGALKRFIGENFMFDDEADSLPEDASFLEAGIIDSTGVLELVAHVESRYGIAIADHELIPSNFDSIGALARFIQRKRGSDGGSHGGINDRLAR